ncbi:MAG: cell division protein FtsQ/DivIB [Candidatus Accumulibacter sp.]|jgi:cell division protein FtsQ|uniref:cell division protein FtsQ/DivIB n=1 Tax=Accumulibacter sp. TaxID=2053492 RepID=UPI001ACD308F|nr:cell division protein FtsQ/DivIB [Accumulibacter sp.]MBK8116951.1 cell division protein FtsQ/DivIB [Accumulibacter sp.]MBK8386500.1 cell division protein FtsQ/DivIB [Accumulibacter sp.]MBK8579991.1 cell division protein FtsQ/DivIB [Candidatus Accumulibacter propinquus]MBN8438312.1 cell division protein FtsQ/DivIB [Accumulibacter sp.]
MWHKPRVMTAVSDLLFLAGAAALLVAAVVWGTPRLRLFPLHEIQVTHALQEVRQSDVEQSLSDVLRGNFFTVDIEALRRAVEQLPWVRRAEVWRKWPSRIEVRIEEHRAAAHWGDGPEQLVNTYGELFSAALSQDQQLPRLSGPVGSSSEVLRRYEEFAQILKPTGRLPAQMALSPRLAWLLKLEDGMLVELGREQAKAPIRMRLQRFVDYYPTLSNTRQGRPMAVDMRYPNGFALRFPASAAQEVKGKK